VQAKYSRHIISVQRKGYVTLNFILKLVDTTSISKDLIPARSGGDPFLHRLHGSNYGEYAGTGLR